jgi:hypothetical protein
MPCRRAAEEGHLPLVRLRLLGLRLLLQRCLPAQERLVPLEWAEGVVAVADAEGLLPERRVPEPHLPAWEVEAAVAHRQRRLHRDC